MTATRSNTQISHKVGDTVQIRRDAGISEGKLVEDFADSLMSDADLGRDWAQPRRWAVALATGVLVFVDDSDLLEGDTVDTP